MPLSEYEQRALERLERLEHNLPSPARRVARWALDPGMPRWKRQRRQACITFVIGYLLFYPVHPLGDIVMFVSFVWGVTAFWSGRSQQHGAFSQVPTATSPSPPQQSNPGQEPPPQHSNLSQEPIARPPVNDIGSEEAFLAAIDETIKYVNDGDIVEGTVIRVDRDEVLLDIGYKVAGVIPSRELSVEHDVAPREVVHTGERIEALVLHKEDKEGRLILSEKRAQYERNWGLLEKIKDENGVIAGTVIEVVKGGLIVDVGLRGFLPASLVELRGVRDLQPYIGREIEAKIIELDKNRNNVVLSRRAWLEQAQSEVRDPPPGPSASSVRPPAVDAPGQHEYAPAAGDIVELLTSYDEIASHAPDADDLVRFIAQRTGVDKSAIYRLRSVRNRCAHPYREGWPRKREFDEALTVARELRRRLSSSS